MVTLRRAGKFQRQCKNEPTPSKPKLSKKPSKTQKSILKEHVKPQTPVKRQTRKRKGAPLLPPVDPPDPFPDEPPLDIPGPIPETRAKKHQTASLKRNTRSRKGDNTNILTPEDNQDTLSVPSKTKYNRTQKDKVDVPHFPTVNLAKYKDDLPNNEAQPSKQTTKHINHSDEYSENPVPSTPAMIEKEEILPSSSINIRRRRKSRVSFSVSKCKKDTLKSENIPTQPGASENIPLESEIIAPDSKTLRITNTKKKNNTSVSSSQDFVVGVRRSGRVSVPVTPLGVKNNDDSGISDSIIAETSQQPKCRTMKQEKISVLTITGSHSETSKTRKERSVIASPSDSVAAESNTKSVVAESNSKVYSSKQSHKRKQKVDADVESEVNKQIIDHSICSLLLKPKRKKKPVVMQPSFESVSPIKVTSKLEELEKSMNLFQCDITPIVLDKKKSPSSRNVFKSPNKSLRNVKGKSAPAKIIENSLLKTPIRNVYSKSRYDSSMDSSLFFDEYQMDSDEDEDEEKDGDEFPLFKNITPKERTRKSRHTIEMNNKMDYDDWLADHASDFSDIKEYNLVIE